MRTDRRLLLSAVGSGLVVTLSTGCGSAGSQTAGPSAGGTPPSSTSAPGSPSTPPSTSLAPPPAAATADLDVLDVATRYLAARENAVSYTHPDARAWLEEVRPVMTAAGWQQLADSLGDRGGYPAATARQRQWSVRVTVACKHNPDAGPATATDITLTCEVTDRTIDAGGIPVPIRDLPALWPYSGPQPAALLGMHREAGQWLVATDQTGQAG